MKRIEPTTRRALALALSMCSALLLGNSMAAAEKPNIVIILADDLGWAGVGYHSGLAETPNIDRLARQGVELDRFYVAPMCSPTRAGLLTGRYPIRFGLARAVIPPYRNFGLPVAEKTIADHLGAAGYQRRAIFGKWHLGHQQRKWHPLSRGFTDFEGHYNGAIDYFTLEREGERDWHVGYEPSGKQGYATDLIAAAASKFIREASAGAAPYLCYVPFNAPHSPFQAKPQDIDRFARGKEPGRAAIYSAMIWSMDQGIGKILAAIEASGEAENTQVWFLSDNGGVGQISGTNTPLRGSKLTTFEGGIRVAACVRWPAAWPGGRKVGETMGYIDVLPTVLASIGQTPAAGAGLDGVDVGAVLAGKSETLPARDWYSYHGQGGSETETIAINTPQWKLIVNGPDIRSGELSTKHQVHLFAMPGDLLERNNLAAEQPELVERLFRKLVTYRSLQPPGAVPAYRAGSRGYEPPTAWEIPAE